MRNCRRRGGHFAEIGISHLFVIRWEQLAAAGRQAGRQAVVRGGVPPTRGKWGRLSIHNADFLALFACCSLSRLGSPAFASRSTQREREPVISFLPSFSISGLVGPPVGYYRYFTTDILQRNANCTGLSKKRRLGYLNSPVAECRVHAT